MSIRVKAQQKKDKHNREKSIKMWFFGKKINKTDKPLARITKKNKMIPITKNQDE